REWNRKHPPAPGETCERCQRAVDAGAVDQRRTQNRAVDSACGCGVVHVSLGLTQAQGQRTFGRVGRILLGLRAHRTYRDDAAQCRCRRALQPIGESVQWAQAQDDFSIRPSGSAIVQVGHDPASTYGSAHRQDVMIRHEQGQGEVADRAAGAENKDGWHVQHCPARLRFESSAVLHAARASRILRSLSFHCRIGTGFPMKTISAKAETVKRDWYLVDASNKTLGRLASELARRLRGKHKTVFTPHVDTGDYLVVINAEKVAATGNKMDDKIYHHVTGYIGNIKSIALKDLLVKHPERVIEIAVKGMLPKNPLGRAMYRKLKVYSGPNHPHTAKQPQAL